MRERFTSVDASELARNWYGYVPVVIFKIPLCPENQGPVECPYTYPIGTYISGRRGMKQKQPQNRTTETCQRFLRSSPSQTAPAKNIKSVRPPAKESLYLHFVRFSTMNGGVIVLVHPPPLIPHAVRQLKYFPEKRLRTNTQNAQRKRKHRRRFGKNKK